METFISVSVKKKLGESLINGIVLTKMKMLLAFALLHVITQLVHPKEVILKKYIFPSKQ